MVFVCLFAERSIYRFGKWLKKTKRKALSASLDKIKEELMLLGLISLLLGQWANWISKICVNSSLFDSKFFICSEEDFAEKTKMSVSVSSNESHIPPKESLTPPLMSAAWGASPSSPRKGSSSFTVSCLFLALLMFSTVASQ